MTLKADIWNLLKKDEKKLRIHQKMDIKFASLDKYYDKNYQITA